MSLNFGGGVSQPYVLPDATTATTGGGLANTAPSGSHPIFLTTDDQTTFIVKASAGRGVQAPGFSGSINFNTPIGTTPSWAHLDAGAIVLDETGIYLFSATVLNTVTAPGDYSAILEDDFGDPWSFSEWRYIGPAAGGADRVDTINETRVYSVAGPNIRVVVSNDAVVGTNKWNNTGGILFVTRLGKS